MKVTNIKIDDFSPKEIGKCAEFSVTLDNSLVIHRVSVIKGEKGYFVAMPNTGEMKLHNNKKRYEDLVHPISKTLSTELSDEVLSVFHGHLEKTE